MEIQIDPTYITTQGNRVNDKSVIMLSCPACGSVAVRRNRSDFLSEMITFSCVNGHDFGWELTDTEASTILFSANILVDPTELSTQLAEKWKYDPAKRFTNSGGYTLASESQVMKIRELGGVNSDAFHELYVMICQYWGYKGFSGWSSNDAGFVIAWLTGKYGEFPPIARIGV